MWQLSVRGENRGWTELGVFAEISAAAHQVLKREGDLTRAAVFFRVYADPLMGKSDAEILSRLEYQGATGFYVLKRQVQ